MPRKPIDYRKSIIYSIVSKTNENLLYIGSTTDIRKRKATHKSHCNNEKDKEYTFRLYAMIRANGGWDAFDMKPVKEFPCENKIQLVIEEERIRKDMNANLNTHKSYITEEEKKEYHKEYDKEYRQQNKEHYAEYKKEYRQQNKERIAEYKKEYYQRRKDSATH